MSTQDARAFTGILSEEGLETGVDGVAAEGTLGVTSGSWVGGWLLRGAERVLGEPLGVNLRLLWPDGEWHDSTRRSPELVVSTRSSGARRRLLTRSGRGRVVLGGRDRRREPEQSIRRPARHEPAPLGELASWRLTAAHQKSAMPPLRMASTARS